MRRIIIALAFVLSFCESFAQEETHDFITYDTLVNVGYAGLIWRVRVTRPANMFTANHPDTASRPCFIHMGGMGEVGSNAALMQSYGPHYWMNNGWDGGVTTGSGKHYPTVFSVQYSQANPRVQEIYFIINHIVNTYRVKRSSVHVAGLSMGASSWTALINYQITNGDEAGMKLVKSIVALQGKSNGFDSGIMPPGVGYNNSSSTSNWTAYGHWAVKYGGRFFGLDGSADGKGVYTPAKAMNDSLAGSAYFANENIGGGGHCCWNTMYDPSRTNWKSTGSPLGTNIVNFGGSQPNMMGTYRNGDNVFTWMFKQGDTTLVGSGTPANQAPSANAGTDQSITLPTSQVSLTGSGTDPDGSISTYAWTKISGPACTITTPASANTTVTGMSAGSYVFQLQVTDNGGLTGIDQVNVTVNSAANQPPTVNAGTDKAITLPTNSTTLTGTSSDADGSIASVQWTKISGGAATLTNATTNTLSLSDLVAGTYVFRYTATDNGGLSSSDDVTVIVNVATGPKVITWSTTSTNIVLNERFAGALTAGDTIYIDFRTGGYRSISWDTLNSDVAGGEIFVRFINGAYITPSASSLQANYMRWCSGVKIIGMVMNDHTDVVVRYIGYSKGITWDGLINNRSSGMGNLYSGSQAAFAGDSANAFNNIKWINCQFSGLFNGGTGGVAIPLGKVATNGYWLNTSIINCTFRDFKSTIIPVDQCVPSKYIDYTNSYNTLIEGCFFDNLGVVPNPCGHAAVINGSCGKLIIRNNKFNYNFGNCIRGSFSDLPILGSNYEGRTLIYNNISFNARKYSFLDPRPTSSGTLTTLTPYVRNRTYEASHIGVVNPGIGAYGNDPYKTAIIDSYGSDSLILKNSYLVGILDTTWGTALGPTLWTESAGTIGYKDTAGLRLVQLWSNAGLADSITLIPTTNGTMYNVGTTPPAYVTKDYAGNDRIIGGTADVGPVEKVVTTPPVASIQGGNRTVSVAAGLSLVSTSYDPDGSLTAWLWEKLSGPAVTITTPTSGSTTIGGLVPGTYVFRLRVTDNSGSQAFAQVTITVNASTGRNFIRYYNRPKKAF